ncbi:hypothetical protein [Streptomyces sp. NPDC046805]|uniref:hypothetical protein n=1 Tax=Streptomyces sp. NPDC046805 TaxID=3155134 RepID=UPI0033F31C52
MVSLALQAGDAATWGSTVVAVGSVLLTIYQGQVQRGELARQNELQSEASQLQRRQIEAAERRALVMEEMLVRLSADRGDVRAGGGATRTASEAPEPVAAQADAPPSDPGPGYGYGYAPPAAPAQYGPPPGSPPDAQSPPAYGSAPLPPFAQPGSRGPQADGGRRPYVPWTLERRSHDAYALRNTGGEVLEKVRINPAKLPPVVRNLPEDAVVWPNEAVEFLMAGDDRHKDGGSVPTEIWVSWEGQEKEVAVPVPPRQAEFGERPPRPERVRRVWRPRRASRTGAASRTPFFKRRRG